MRQSIEVEGFSHQNPIPAASRVGPLLETGIIGPFDPGSRSIPDDVQAQLANLFRHVGAILEAAGGEWGDVVKMSFFVGDLSLRSAINEPWVAQFPDPAARPARHTQLADLSGAAKVSCVFTAYITD